MSKKYEGRIQKREREREQEKIKENPENHA